MSAVRSNEMIEEENERLTKEMANKVSVLKAVRARLTVFSFVGPFSGEYPL